MKKLIKEIVKKLKRVTKKILKRVYTLIFCDPYHRIKNKRRSIEPPLILHHTYDARELFFQENDVTGFNRYDMIVRLLAIENYYGENDFGWELYRKQQNTRKGGDWENAEQRFRDLIKSYEENGYDDSSEIQIGSDLRLWDGSHRMALAMYHKHYKISCKVMPSSRPIYYGINWYHENGFTLEEIERIHNRYLQLKEEIQIPFICTLWAPVAPYYDEIVERLKLICDVESYTDYSFDEYSYAQMARKVYAVDDIEKWKIEKKIEYMRQNVADNQWKIRVVKLKLNTPRFRRKDSTQNTLSQECEDIKRIIRNCYKDKLPNYFHDIICHIGDNFYQNEFIANLFEYRKLNVSAVLKAIKPFNYVLTKMVVPYMPTDFPKSYPLGKDIDIIVSASNFSPICEMIEESLKVMQLPYEIRVIEKTIKNMQFRVENNGELIFLFDVFYGLEDIKDGFVEHVLERKVRAGKYFIPHKSDELILRIYEIMHNNSKKHHIEYVQQHVDDFEASIGEKYLSPMAREIWNSIVCDANGENPMGGGKFANELQRNLLELKIDLMLHHVPFDSICVVGSSVLTAYGIRKNHDVDFVMTSNYRKSFNSSSVVPFSENVEMVSENWARSNYRKPITDDVLIMNSKYHFMYQGVKFASLSLLLERKEWQSREKDIADVESIKQFIQSQEYKERI